MGLFEASNESKTTFLRVGLFKMSWVSEIKKQLLFCLGIPLSPLGTAILGDDENAPELRGGGVLKAPFRCLRRIPL